MKIDLVRFALVFGWLSLSWAAGGRAQEPGGAPEQGAVPVVAEQKKGADALAPVSVDLLAAPLDEVSKALSKATGVPILPGSVSLPGVFSLTAKERPFWEVFAELSRQNTLLFRPTRNAIELNVRGVATPMLVAGPTILFFEVTRPGEVVALRGAAAMRGAIPGGNHVIPRFEGGRGPGAEPPPPAEASFVVWVAAAVDPRLLTTRGLLTQVEVTDERRRPLKVLDVHVTPAMSTGPRTGPWRPWPGDFDRINLWTWRIAVVAPDDGSKTVGAVKGVLHMQVSTGDLSVRLDDVENKHQGEATEIGNCRFTLTSATIGRQGNPTASLKYVAEVKGPAATPGAPLRIELQNAAGEPLIAAWETRATSSGLHSTDPSVKFPLTSPLAIVLKTSERMEAMAVPFEMKLGGEE